jgi:hypothetical protein
MVRFGPKMAKKILGNLEPTPRVKEILRLLDRSPLPAHLIREGSITFGETEEGDGSFATDRRVRQKMQQIVAAGLASEHDFTLVGRGAMKFYQLAPAGYRLLYQVDPPDDHRKFFRPVAKLNWEHTYANAKVIIKTTTAAHSAGIRVTSFCRERELTLATVSHSVEPDHFFQFHFGGRFFNVFAEVDLNTETLDGFHPKAWRQRILAYEAYQDWLIAVWRQNGRHGPEPRCRVVFLTTSTYHAYHLLSLARSLAPNPGRRLFLAATLDEYLSAADPLRSPILLDHHGNWESIVNLHASASFERSPVKLPRQLVAPAVLV